MHHLDGKCRNHGTARARGQIFVRPLQIPRFKCITCPNATVREPTFTPSRARIECTNFLARRASDFFFADCTQPSLGTAEDDGRRARTRSIEIFEEVTKI